MEVEYNLNLEDVRAFTFNLVQRSAKKSKSWSFSHLILVAFVLIWAASYFTEDLRLLELLKFAAVMLLGVWIGVIFSALHVLRLSRRSEVDYIKDPKNHFLFGSRRLSLDTEGVTTISEGFLNYLPWKGIVDIAVTDNHVFIYDGTLHAQVVPKRAFRDEQQFQDFVALARQYQQGAKPTGILAGLPPPSDAFTRPDAL